MTTEDLTTFTHGIIAILHPGATTDREPIANFEGLDIYHYCGYQNTPTQIAFDALTEELKTDPAFNFDFEFDLMFAPEPVANYFSKSINDFVAAEDLVERAARKVLLLEGAEHDDYVASLRDGKESPRENGRWQLATEAARVAIDLMEEDITAPEVRHKKRGSSYTILGELEIQTSAPIHEGDIITGYRCCETGKLWGRPVGEFNDGRFENVKR